MGACCALIAPPLTHMLPDVRRVGLPIRMIPNFCYLDDYRHPDLGVHGGWVRPEDVDAYADYVSTFEFGRQPLDREKTLLDIYQKDKEWPGDLNMIIQDLQVSATNRLIRPKESRKRMECGQRCEVSGVCRACDRLLELADPELVASLKHN